MSMAPFEQFFPHVADKETRRIMLMGEPGWKSSLPPGNYYLNERYCHDEGCDCRRVLFEVVHEESMTLVAMISFGFDCRDPLRGPFIDPLHPKAPYALEFLDLLKTTVISDRAYLARCERHYEMVKSIQSRGGSRSHRQDQDDERRQERPLAQQKPRPLTPIERKAAQKRLHKAMKVLKQRVRV
jgi:hypothetical protein